MYVRAAVGAVVDGAGVLAIDRVVEAVLVHHDLAVQCLAGGDLLAQLGEGVAVHIYGCAGGDFMLPSPRWAMKNSSVL